MSTPGSGPWSDRPKLVVAGYAVFTLLVCLGLKDLWYDHNLLNLQAEGLESVKLEKKLLQSDCGASFAVVMAKSREEAHAAESDVRRPSSFVRWWIRSRRSAPTCRPTWRKSSR